MSKFHSTLSRRDFMKGLGLGAAGLGVAVAAAPVFRDMDEVMASPSAGHKRPWWVKERDFMDPTVEIDWSMVKRYNSNYGQYMQDDEGNYLKDPDTGLMVALRGKYWSPTSSYPLINGLQISTPSSIQRVRGQLNKKRSARATAKPQEITERARMYIDWAKGKFPDFTNPTLRDFALTGAVASNRYKYCHPRWGGTECFLGTRSQPNPEERGVPKWQGTPEENLRTLRAAARYFGASEVGVTELDDNTKKLIYSEQRPQKASAWYHREICQARGFSYSNPPMKLDFEDVDDAYENEDLSRAVIPNKCKWAISYTVRQPPQTTRRPAPMSSAGSSQAYQEGAVIENRIQEFLWGLGYLGLEGGTGAMAPSNSFATLCGIGEPCRLGISEQTPEVGNAMRITNTMLTDLPLAPTKPIDFGVMRFCRTCLICFTDCIYEALSGDEEPTFEVTGYWNNPGYRGYRCNHFKCTSCGLCQGICPFASLAYGHALIHPLIQTVISHTTILNSFFANMHETFGYGLKGSYEGFWDMEYPSGGLDTSIGYRP